MDDVLSAISHKIRRQIIMMIGDQGAVSYTDLSELGLEPGTLYFHLDNLSKSDNPLVLRPGDKLYSLTDLGQAAYTIIQHSEDQVEGVSPAEEGERTATYLIQKALSMEPIIKRIQADPFRFFFEIVVFLGLYGYFASEVGFLPVFLFFLQGTFDTGITILAALVAWLSTYLFVEGLSVPILKKPGLSRELLASVPMAFIPHILIELMWYFIPTLNVLSGWLLTIILTCIIAWSTGILTIALARAKTVRKSRAVIVTLIVTNLNLLLLAVISVALV
ncbi:MAG: winged helix-turn-helix domain-containing protein [Candidatus Thorarchaeota archaeon]